MTDTAGRPHGPVPRTWLRSGSPTTVAARTGLVVTAPLRQEPGLPLPEADR
ncbi:hypothetical protein [Streptomyces pratensis]|uniref:hypothetical protein n=1 Tax=Streptomyces pratensis TaxID=1169025 RepID=UPI001933DB35|nr:hypothetical protein [Streptomyces pratensis]